VKGIRFKHRAPPQKANGERVNEDKMHTLGNHHGGRLQTGKTGCISIHTSDPERPLDQPSAPVDSLRGGAQTIPPALFHLFEHSERLPATLPERFPRLTFMAIAIALLVTALTAEFDYLRGAGYFWP
jgi:hypothetical protein